MSWIELPNSKIKLRVTDGTLEEVSTPDGSPTGKAEALRAAANWAGEGHILDVWGAWVYYHKTKLFYVRLGKECKP